MSTCPQRTHGDQKLWVTTLQNGQVEERFPGETQTVRQPQLCANTNLWESRRRRPEYHPPGVHFDSCVSDIQSLCLHTTPSPQLVTELYRTITNRYSAPDLQDGAQNPPDNFAYFIHQSQEALAMVFNQWAAKRHPLCSEEFQHKTAIIQGAWWGPLCHNNNNNNNNNVVPHHEHHTRVRAMYLGTYYRTDVIF
jgi:hypothetical protein